MSNLYKQWYVRPGQPDARVINSNAIMREFLAKNNVMPQDGVQAGFTEGLPVKEEEPDYVELAKEEAQRILSEAEGKAKELVGQAQSEAKGIEEDAKNQGYRQGKAQLEKELDALRGKLEGSYQQKGRKLEGEYREKQKNMEKELVDVMVDVFNKVFHIQFDNKKPILMHLIEDAILGIEDEKKFLVKVAPDSVQFLEEHKEGILDRVGHNIEIEILEDSTMRGNDCTIETNSGVFDCSLGTQLENLIKDIRSLCA